MAVLKGISRSKRQESLSKGLMVDTVRGQIRVRKWPRKRGTPESALQRWWIDWFKQANKLAKYVDAASARRAIELTAGTGKYPRDILLAAMRGRLYSWQDQYGKKWYPMAAVQDISESLDVLAQSVGDILCRATDRWRAPDPGDLDDVLTNMGAGNPPEWRPASIPGGIIQEVLAGTPIVPDGTKSFYDIDVSAYADVTFDHIGVTFAASSRFVFRMSTDGGITFKSAGGNYRAGYVSASADAWGSWSAIFQNGANSASNQYGHAKFGGLRAGRASWLNGGSHASGAMMFWAGWAHFDSPITHIRCLSYGGANFTGGTIRAVGNR